MNCSLEILLQIVHIKKDTKSYYNITPGFMWFMFTNYCQKRTGMSYIMYSATWLNQKKSTNQCFIIFSTYLYNLNKYISKEKNRDLWWVVCQKKLKIWSLHMELNSRKIAMVILSLSTLILIAFTGNLLFH